MAAPDDGAPADEAVPETHGGASTSDDRSARDRHAVTGDRAFRDGGGDTLARPPPDAGAVYAAPELPDRRLRHQVVSSYEAVDLWRGAHALCSASEGHWQPVLASCGCPPRTVFTVQSGCVAAPRLRPRAAGCEGDWVHLPSSCFKEMSAGGVTMHFTWGNAKRPKAHFAAFAEGDWTRFFAGRLMVPAAPSALHLVNGKKFTAPVLAWLGYDAAEPLPLAAPFSPRAAMHEGDDTLTAPTCVSVLERAQADPNVIVPMCEGLSTTIAAIRRPGAPQPAVLRALTVSTNDQANTAQVVGTYAWQGIFSAYHVPWIHGMAPTRFVTTRHVDGQRVTAFLSPAATVHAWVVDGSAQPVPMLFDDAGKLVH